ncbi:MFS transporter [Paraburkholderia hospita]|jgi:ACS family glucarate transporter-like MFS transporter|uniref:MFS transporter n=1 Tax=Paraburkholderia hospita TaxID=169430 RepID=A0AAJ4VN19_9BURK|nr:MFS transporter [Paraburkholderia hospita]EUC16566.1 major facilitator superfamily MFS_1 [Burkholderia sp. BT03]AUT72824.1 MFS transporter [Paraburkholderia hospita]AXF01272.1 MFS transporter [Paraburkholderia hospita]EIM97259.1 major facilitator transporter [Paraburkholderia hospita]OUL74525.1 MFS transporter [Paraburkholderia hospita]
MKRFRVTSATSIVLLMLCIMYFITYLDRVNVSTAAAGFGKEFHLSHTEIGLVFSAFAYPYLVFQIIGGWVSDRFGAKRTLIACGAIWALATLLTGFAGGLVSLLFARVLLGFGEGATFPAATAAMSRWVAKEKRGFAQGITHAAARIGNAVAPGVIVLVMTTWGWRESFYICGAFSLLWVVVWAMTFTEYPKEHRRITQEELDFLPPPKAKMANVPWKALFKRMAPVTIVYFCYGWTLWLFLSWIPQYFLHSYQLDLKKSAIFASAVFFAGVIGDTLGGIVTDKVFERTGNLRRARSWMVSICMLLTLASLVPLMLTHNLYVSMVCLSAGFFFAEMTIGPMWAIPMDIAPEYSGTASGMMNTGSALAAIISPVLSGYLIDTFGSWELPFAGSMLLMAIGVVLAFRMQPESRFETGAEPSAQPATRFNA